MTRLGRAHPSRRPGCGALALDGSRSGQDRAARSLRPWPRPRQVGGLSGSVRLGIELEPFRGRAGPQVSHRNLFRTVSRAGGSRSARKQVADGLSRATWEPESDALDDMATPPPPATVRKRFRLACGNQPRPPEPLAARRNHPRHAGAPRVAQAAGKSTVPEPQRVRLSHEPLSRGANGRPPGSKIRGRSLAEGCGPRRARQPASCDLAAAGPRLTRCRWLATTARERDEHPRSMSWSTDSSLQVPGMSSGRSTRSAAPRRWNAASARRYAMG